MQSLQKSGPVELLPDRHQQLVSLLRPDRQLTIEELAGGLRITGNAVRQHLVVLECEGLVRQSGTQPSDGGRPRQLYGLTEKARELLPRQYSWFAQLLVELLREQLGSARLKEKLHALGRRVGQSLASQDMAEASSAGRARRLATAMAEIGYQARQLPGGRADQVIEATNCVFHQLAAQHPEICQFDLGLMSAFAHSTVTHEECMVRGGKVCRFRLGDGKSGAGAGPGNTRR